MNHRRLFPDVSFPEWIELWKRGYSEEYGGGADVEYASLMDGVHNATDFDSTIKAVEKFFGWKDRFSNRWIKVVTALTSDDWERLKSSAVMPEFWKSGAVYNVFLWHVATRGERPLIDQHAWRAYCWVIGRTDKPEFPVDREVALGLYSEYQNWFIDSAAGFSDKRDVDRALMAFGQFCSRFPGIVKHYFGVKEKC